MNRRAALELPMNLIVVIIISITVFSLGIIMAKELYFTAEESVIRINDQTKNQIYDMLDQGQAVVNPFPKRDAQRGDMAGFPIGIRNILDSPEETFTIKVAPSGINPPAMATENWITLDKDEITLKSGERDIVLLAIDVPRNAKLGTYAFVIKITLTYDSTPYGEPERVTVVVK